MDVRVRPKEIHFRFRLEMIPYGRQSINEDDIKSVELALKGELLTTGPLVETFEKNLSEKVGAPTTVVSSGTAALHCAYAAIGIEQGDEIITPPITFVATQATAASLGAKIVFVDVQKDTGNINPELIAKAITPRTKAIVAVDYAGHPAELNELKSIADNHGLYLIEDAAHSIGSTYKGKPIGSIADITTFSFFPTKNLTTGEGGAVSSTNPKLLSRAKRFARQGLVREPDQFRLVNDGPWHQEVHEFGLNYRLPDVLCALGISQLKRLEEFKKRRREIFAYYTAEFSDLDWLQLPIERSYVSSNWHLFPIRVPPERRREIFDKLRNQSVGVQVNYIPAYRHPAFSEYKIESKLYPASEEFYSREISIPMHAGLSDNQIELVAAIVKSLY